MFHQVRISSSRASSRPKSAASWSQDETPSLEPYIFEKLLGAGTYAKVYRAHVGGHNPRENSAIKCISRKNVRTKVAVNILTNEIEVLKKLKHPHIVEMISFEWDSRFIYIVMEYCSNGDFSTVIQRNRGFVTETDAKYYFRQLMDAMCYLNSQNVAHLDLKPKNLLLTNKKQLKVADFGFALILSATDSVDNAFALRGTPLYMAPEIVKNAARLHSQAKGVKSSEGERSIFDARSDLWSCGVILHEILYGRCPVDGSSSQEVLEKLLRLDDVIVAKQEQDRVSNECCDMLTRLLKVLPEDRITFSELETHPFIDLQSYRKRNEAKYKADHNFSEGNKNLLAGNKVAAINAYATGAKYLMDLIQTEACTEERNRLRREVKRFTEKAEKLKTGIVSKEKREVVNGRVASAPVSRSFSQSGSRSKVANEMTCRRLFGQSSNQSFSYFTLIFKDHPEVVQKYEQTQPGTLIHFLEQNGFDECKNLLIDVIDFYKDFVKTTQQILSDEENKLIRSEIFRLLETAEKLVEETKRQSLRLDLTASACHNKNGVACMDESTISPNSDLIRSLLPGATCNESPGEEQEKSAGTAHLQLKDDSIDPEFASVNPSVSHSSQCTIQ